MRMRVRSGVRLFQFGHSSGLTPFPAGSGHMATEQTSPAKRALLLNHKLVRPTEEDLRWQVPTRLAAQRALQGD